MGFDAAIIGAGPAGGMAAVTLAGAGLRLAIIEKNQLPRNKACAGALFPRTLQLLDPSMLTVIERRIHTVTTLYGGARKAVFHNDREPLLTMVTRRRFDMALIQHALRIGGGNVTLMDGYSVRRIEESKDRVRIVGRKGDAVTADWVIAADGARSRTAGCLNLNRRQSCGLALEATVVPGAGTWPEVSDAAVFDYGCVQGGYGWIFPKADHLSCGVGSWCDRTGLGQAFQQFLRARLPESAVVRGRVRYHPIPIYRGLGRIATRRVCLAGDAAGLVEPITGEGIENALKSGALAANAVLVLVTDGSRPMRPDAEGLAAIYPAQIRRQIADRLDVIHRLAVPVYREAPAFFYRTFIRGGVPYPEVFRNLAMKRARSVPEQPTGRDR